MSKGKQANIFRIPPSISPRSSKSILAKLKFFKKNQTSDSAIQSNNQSYCYELKPLE